MKDTNFYPDRPISQYHKCDLSLIVSMVLMWGIGLWTLYICSSNYSLRMYDDKFVFLRRQLIASGIGFLGLLFFALIPLEKIKKILPYIVLFSILLCLLTFVPVIGEERNGARRWIRLPFFTFQPSELVKFTFVLFLANFFDKYEKETNEEKKSVFPAVVGLVVFTSLIFAQKDFSTGVFIFMIGVVLFFVCGAKLIWLLPICTLGFPAIAMLIMTEPYRLNRLLAYISPDAYADSYNFQKFASLRAINTGGFWGQGIGTGLSRLNRIPEVQADYIFAGWTEAMGFVGVVFYICLLLVFVYKAYKCAITCPNRFGSIGTFGCMCVILFQSLMNLGVVCGLLPATGIPLPFFSSGGSSMIVTLCMCGFMLNAARSENDLL